MSPVRHLILLLLLLKSIFLFPIVLCCKFPVCTWLYTLMFWRRLEWKNFDIVVSSSKMINVRNVNNDAKEKLDFRDRIIKVSMGFKHLVVATSSQVYIYRYAFAFCSIHSGPIHSRRTPQNIFFRNCVDYCCIFFAEFLARSARLNAWIF